jgi:hypothetical protein
VEYKFYVKRDAEKKNVETKKKQDEAGPSTLGGLRRRGMDGHLFS